MVRVLSEGPFPNGTGQFPGIPLSSDHFRGGAVPCLGITEAKGVTGRHLKITLEVVAHC
ncbi:hypothetical protein [Streptomyces europaeiscabiei]|uniref:hypothetical protein n=1 Tax=Streptomyces europaeiscabiei TaxID=146819 RepID=UPI002E0DD8B5|nr:hypothetical protein OHB30_40430 [Streptomyces europaeiscabiei]